MRRTSKAKNQKAHARQRAMMRFGLGPRDVEEIAKMIRRGKSSMVRAGANKHTTVHEVIYEGVVIHAVYDRRRSQVITLTKPKDDQCL